MKNGNKEAAIILILLVFIFTSGAVAQEINDYRRFVGRDDLRAEVVLKKQTRAKPLMVGIVPDGGTANYFGSQKLIDELSGYESIEQNESSKPQRRMTKRAKRKFRQYVRELKRRTRSSELLLEFVERRGRVNRKQPSDTRAIAAISVTRLILIDVRSGQPVPGYNPIPERGAIRTDVPREFLTLRADVTSGVQSVEFHLNGRKFRTESHVPYAAAGDYGGSRYIAWDRLSQDNKLVVKAVPFSSDSGRGVEGASLSRELRFSQNNQQGFSPTPTPEISEPPATSLAVRSFTLIDTRSGEPIPGYDPVPTDGRVTTSVPRQYLTIRAETTSDVDSLQFFADDNLEQTESYRPYAAAGDAGSTYYPWDKLNQGDRVVVRAVPYSANGAQGVSGNPYTITFNFSLGNTSQPTQTPEPAASPQNNNNNNSNHNNHSNHGDKKDLSTLPVGTEGITYASLKPTEKGARSTNSRDTFRTRVAWTHYSYNDPIVFPGQEGATHLHLFFGNALVDHNTTAANIRTKCRSAAAGGTANCSGYWIPALLDRNGDVLPPDFSLWYYKAGYSLSRVENLVTPPVGLAMVQGDAKATPDNPQTNSGRPLGRILDRNGEYSWGDSGRFYSFNCGNSYKSRKPYIPGDCPEGSILKLSVAFPICWNGQDLDSPDHISHMANPRSGECPSSHPFPLPTISFNMEWEVPAGGTKGWHLSSDMYQITDQTPGGFSMHADWMNGWDPEIFELFNANCNRVKKDCVVERLLNGFVLDSSHQKRMRR